GLHESQSRLWENLVGRSRPFWRRYTPVMHEVFGETMHGATPEDVYRQVNRVTPSLIRVEADEVTYNMHILVRFELELALLRRDRIHRPGYLFEGEDLVRRVTGSGLVHEPFMAYLWAKYGDLYGVERNN